MRVRRLLFLFPILASCSVIEAPEEFGPEAPVQSESMAACRSGEVRVLFDENLALQLEEAAETGMLVTKSDDLNNVFSDLGISSARRLFPYAGEFEPRTRKEGLHRWYVVEFDETVPVSKAESDFSCIPGVEIVEPVRSVSLTGFDDLDSRLWGLYNPKKGGVDINVVPVWENYTTGSPEVVVNVVDDGIDVRHEDLAANCVKEGHFNFVDRNSVIVPGDHGCHVSGTIAGVSNNGVGVAGIAGGDYLSGIPGVKLLSSQCFKTDSKGNTTSGDFAAAIKWGADHGAVISQNSWGYNYDYDYDGVISGEEREAAAKAVISQSDKAAVDYFIAYAGCDNEGNQLPDSPMKGGVVIFAAGNDALTNASPANYAPIIAVGSVDDRGRRSDFSNYGDWVDICAPGESIYSTLPYNTYGPMNGTSMACPHVSGVAALVVSYSGGQGFTADMLTEKLIEGADRELVSYSDKIGGLLDALGAVTYGSDAEPEPVTDLKMTSKSNCLYLSWTVGEDSDGKPVYGYYVFTSTDKDAVDMATVEDHSGARMDICIPALPSGTSAECVIKGLEFEKKYYAKVVAYGYNMKRSEASQISESVTQTNLPPEILYDGELSVSLRSFEQISLYMAFSEPDSHEYKVSHSAGSEAESFKDNLDGRWVLTIDAKNADPGTYQAKVTAEDEYGCRSELVVGYDILPNTPPQLKSEIDDILLKNKGEEFVLEMDRYFVDQDGEQLKYECSVSNEKVLYLHVNGNKIYGTVTGYGGANVTVTALDAKGEKCETSFKVLVRNSDAPVEVYPNPVKDYLYVATESEGIAHITVTSSSGRSEMDVKVETGLFDPARLDLRALAPGMYSVRIETDGSEYVRSVAKL